MTELILAAAVALAGLAGSIIVLRRRGADNRSIRRGSASSEPTPPIHSLPTTTQSAPSPDGENEIPRGLTLRHTLSWPEVTVARVAWSPDGRLLAAVLSDHSIGLWDRVTGEQLAPLLGHTQSIMDVAWAPRSHQMASISVDQTMRIWNVYEGGRPLTIELGDALRDVSWHPDGERIAVASERNVKIFSPAGAEVAQVSRGYCIAVRWSPDGEYLAFSNYDSVIVHKSSDLLSCATFNYHGVQNLQWFPDSEMLAAGSHGSPYQVRIGRVDSEKTIVELEGHSNAISAISFSWDGLLMATKSYDQSVRIVRCDTWAPVVQIRERTRDQRKGGLAFDPMGELLATLSNGDAAVRIWDYDTELLKRAVGDQAVRHTAVKVVLVGEAGVGKSSLGWRLAHDEFKEHSSTHGQQFWVLDSLRATRSDGTSCEAILWDLAGQPDYRLVHSLFLDDAELALILFNPADRNDPMRGVEFWLRALQQPRSRPRRVLLVGARSDRGEPSLTRAEIDAFCRSRGISGYVSTSALTGEGIPQLVERARELIVWDEMVMTVTTITYKRIKDFVLALKEDLAHDNVLVSLAELRDRLEQTDPLWVFSNDEMRTAVDHLAAYGYVRVLRIAAGDERVLLRPELLNNVASSMVIEARRNPKGLGALEEATLLRGGYDFPELRPLAKVDQEILLEAAELLFLEHHICFRESLGSQVFLIFPELINLKKPAATEGQVTEEGDTYIITGPVTNVYAALVVRLGYTNIFTRTDQWHDQAQYELASGEACGFRLIAEREGEVEIVLYYAVSVAESDRRVFQGLIERFLASRRVVVTRFPPLGCDSCGYRQERAEIVRRAQEERGFMFCSNCGHRILLPVSTDRVSEAALTDVVAQEQIATTLRTRFEAAQVQMLSFIRSRRPAGDPPSCFVSYAWGVPDHERWVEKKLATDLRNAGIEVTLDRWHNAEIGADLARFVSRIESARNVIAVATPLYREKYENKLSSTGSVVAAEVDVINLRLLGTQEQKKTVMPVLLEGSRETSLPPLMRGKVFADFRNDSAYFSTLFDLVLTLYEIPFDDNAVADLRESLREDAHPIEG